METQEKPGDLAANGAGTATLTTTSVSVIVPTYHEAENLSALIERLAVVRDQHGLSLELLIMDDDSNDGSEQIVADLAHKWVHLIVRKQNPGLSAAVLDGLARATGDIAVVMDADLSHPPERIPDLVAALDHGYECAIGSRYVDGGSTDAAWGPYRWVNSKIATLLARPFTSARDPMAGFFAFRREALESADYLNPVGYKVGLELIVKCNFKRIAEVPIHFADRTKGESKLTFREQLRYIQHLRRLFIYRYDNLASLMQFLVVGASGLVVNLLVLTMLLWAQVPAAVAVAMAIAVSIVSNFVLNRRFTFSYARQGPLLAQFAGFVAACSLGAVINYATTLTVLELVPALLPQLAATVGVIAGTGSNFLLNRYAIFRKTRPKHSPPETPAVPPPPAASPPAAVTEPTISQLPTTKRWNKLPATHEAQEAAEHETAEGEA